MLAIVRDAHPAAVSRTLPWLSGAGEGHGNRIKLWPVYDRPGLALQRRASRCRPCVPGRHANGALPGEGDGIASAWPGSRVQPVSGGGRAGHCEE
ncbi:hypothetical protein GCM10009646_82080 [Streptomyces aureus]